MSYKDISLGDTVTVTTSSGVVVSVIIKDDVEDLKEEDTKREIPLKDTSIT